MRRGKLQIGQPGVGVAETIELEAHAIHQREVQAAHLAILCAGVQVVEGTAGL